MAIKLNDDYQIETDGIQWILFHRKDGKNPKTGEPTVSWKKTYYPSLEQVAGAITRYNSYKCGKLEDIININQQAAKDICKALEAVDDLLQR